MQADFLRRVYSSDPPLSDEDMIMGMAEVVKQASPVLEEFIASLNKPDYGTDDRNNQFDRISFMSETMLRMADPPMTQEQMRTIYDRINSPQMKALRAQLDEIGRADEDNGLNYVEDFPALRTVITLWTANAMNIGAAAGANVRSERELSGPAYAAPMSMLADKVRSIVKAIAPQVALILDNDHPPYAAFHAAEDPSKLPDSAGRRDFLIRHLNEYEEHEKTFDRNFTHGRGHIVRAFIYGSVMCSMLEEMGIPMERSAVLCGIVMHDSGREGNGSDQWEAASANNAVTKMRTDFKVETLGQDYEKDLTECIASHEGKTLEAMLLAAADSLDIGRTQEFNPSYFPFLLGRGGESTTGQAREWRNELIAEADLLQRLTNPGCSWRNALNRLQKEGFENPELTEMYMNQKRELDEEIRQAFEKEWQMSSEDYVRHYENIIANNPQIFPLFSRYYRP